MLQEELLRQIRLIDIKVRRQVESSLQGSYHSLFKGHGLEFQEVREYLPGEDARLIDWNVTARMAKPFVRVYREERELTVLLIVDISASTRFGRAWSGREVMATIGAALAFSAIRNGDKAGLLLFSDRIEEYIPPRRGRNHLLTIIRALLATAPQGKGTDPDVAFRFVTKALKKRSLLFFLSDMHFPVLPESAALAVRRHEMIPIGVFDRLGHDSFPFGAVRVRDPERGETGIIDLASAAREAWNRFRAEKDEAFRRLNTPSLWIENHPDFINDLVGGFRRLARERRR